MHGSRVHEGAGRKWGLAANVYRVSFGGYVENVLKLWW